MSAALNPDGSIRDGKIKEWIAMSDETYTDDPAKLSKLQAAEKYNCHHCGTLRHRRHPGTILFLFVKGDINGHLQMRAIGPENKCLMLDDMIPTSTGFTDRSPHFCNTECFLGWAMERAELIWEFASLSDEEQEQYAKGGPVTYHIYEKLYKGGEEE